MLTEKEIQWLRDFLHDIEASLLELGQRIASDPNGALLSLTRAQSAWLSAIGIVEPDYESPFSADELE